MKKMIAVLLALTLVFTLAACSSSAPDPGSSDASQPSSSTANNSSTESTAPADGEGYDIVFIPKGVADFWSIVSGGFEQAAKDAGMTPRVVYPDKEEASRQVEVMYDVINSKPDAIVLSPVNVEPLIAPCQAAQEAGIPVILVDTLIASDDYVCAFATDNVTAGALAADEMAKRINNEGKVHIFAGSPASTSNVDRVKGFTDRMAEAYPDIEVIGTLYSEADINLCTTQAVDVITANPDIKGMFAVDETRTSGVGTALTQLGKEGEIIVGGFDSNPDSAELMRNGTVQFLTVQQPYQMGYQGFEAAVKTLNGEELAHETVDTGCTVVPAEKMEEEEMQRLLFPLDYIGQ